MKNNKGVTLMELLIAMSLLTLIMFAGGSVYLSSSNIYTGISGWTQAQSNAQIAMMHIKKYTKDCASNFGVVNNGVLEFMVFANPNDVEPTIRRRYEFRDGGISYRASVGAQETIIGRHINNCIFSVPDDDGHILQVVITAVDNNGENPYTLISRVSAGATSIPAVCQI